MAVMSREEWRRRRRRKRRIQKYAILGGLALIFLLVLLLIIKLITALLTKPDDGLVKDVKGLTVKQELLTVSDYSRTGNTMETINNIVIHYAGNPGTSAAEVRDYYESLKDKKDSTESVHFIIGLDGTVIQCIPLTEVACANMGYNKDSIAIEYCNTGSDGSMSEATYQALVKLVAYLSDRYEVPNKNIVRHYDVTGSVCPLYFVQNEESWKQFLQDVEDTADDKTVTFNNSVIRKETAE